MNEKEILICCSDNVHNNKEDNIINTVQRSIPLTEGMSLYYALQMAGIAFSAPCAGNGTCGACKVKLLEGNLVITKKDQQRLNKEQLEDGWRLACQAYPSESCAIYVPKEEFAILTQYYDKEGSVLKKKADSIELTQQEVSDSDGGYAIAIDLGTTTIAYELFIIATGETIRTIASSNPQRVYGADVVTRMEQSDNGRREILKHTLRRGMREDIAALLEGVGAEKIKAIAISGNTAMVHLFMGYSCEGLDRYPFTPVTLETIESDAIMLNLMNILVPVLISAGISAYVGGDVLSGLVSQHFLSEENPRLFIDLGTNAEMALLDGHGKIYVTSAPAGPAFEAANLSCGVGSIEGAIRSMNIRNGEQTVQTIGEKEPVGFCGSGILEAIYELLKNNLIDETGLLTEAYFEKGYPIGRLKITQQDIRQIQMAKSAVFSAISILTKKANLTVADIDKIYLAGAFGFHINVEKAIGIGLLPADFSGRIQVVGNASLCGTKEILRNIISREEQVITKAACEEIYLSNENDFQMIFMENMNFCTTPETS